MTTTDTTGTMAPHSDDVSHDGHPPLKSLFIYSIIIFSLGFQSDNDDVYGSPIPHQGGIVFYLLH